jgi:hypothetical protein
MNRLRTFISRFGSCDEPAEEQAGKGKLVFINIHQPGSETYKMFDRVMFIDRELPGLVR